MKKSIDLSSIKIVKVIVHDVPRHLKDDKTTVVNCSEQESKLTDGLRDFFKDKVILALSSEKAFKICYDSESDSPVGFLVNDILTNNKNFVDRSKQIAEHLFNIQVGVNPGGILVIMYGTVNNHDTCLIMKLEKDKGAQLVMDSLSKSFNISEVENLMLTQKTQIFKVALLIQKDNFKCKFDGQIMDYQINVKQKKDVTTYFIHKFLGCKPFEDPKITTKRFYDLTKKFIETIDDIILQTKYTGDLNSYIQKNSVTLSPKEFADDYFTITKHKNDYKSYLESKNFKFSAFTRDIELISSKITKISISFENDITIIGTEGTLKDKVNIEKIDGDVVRAEIISKIKKVS